MVSVRRAIPVLLPEILFFGNRATAKCLIMASVAVLFTSEQTVAAKFLKAIHLAQRGPT